MTIKEPHVNKGAVPTAWLVSQTDRDRTTVAIDIKKFRAIMGYFEPQTRQFQTLNENTRKPSCRFINALKKSGPKSGRVDDYWRL